VRALQGRMSLAASVSWLDLPVLVSLLGLAAALGMLARASAFPGDALHSAGAPLTAVVAALASVLVNNLPAAVLLSSTGHPNVNALLLGLNVGPNLAVSGSLAVLLWWRAARASGLQPSAVAYSRQGLVLASLAIAAALALGAA
jgi:arsenical pump membrane protein